MTNLGAPDASHRTPQERASDPSTTAHELQQLAADHPEVRALIAGHPAAYPGLLEWLGSLGDSNVNAALLERKNSLLPPEVAATITEETQASVAQAEQFFGQSPSAEPIAEVEAEQPAPVEESAPEAAVETEVTPEPAVAAPTEVAQEPAPDLGAFNQPFVAAAPVAQAPASGETPAPTTIVSPASAPEAPEEFGTPEPVAPQSDFTSPAEIEETQEPAAWTPPTAAVEPAVDPAPVAAPEPIATQEAVGTPEPEPFDTPEPAPWAPSEQAPTATPEPLWQAPVAPVAAPVEPAVEPVVPAAFEPVAPAEPAASAEPVAPAESVAAVEPVAPSEPAVAEQASMPAEPAFDPTAPAAQPVGSWSGATNDFAPASPAASPVADETADNLPTRTSAFGAAAVAPVVAAQVPTENAGGVAEQAPVADTVAQAPVNPFAPAQSGEQTEQLPAASPFAPPGAPGYGTNETAVLPELTPVGSAPSAYGNYQPEQYAGQVPAEAQVPPVVYKPRDGRTLATLLVISLALTTTVVALWESGSTSIVRDVFAVTTTLLLLASVVFAVGVIVRAVRRRFPGQALFAGWTLAALVPSALYYGLGTTFDLLETQVDAGSQMDQLLTSLYLLFQAIDSDWGRLIYLALPLVLALVTFLVTLSNRKLAVEELAEDKLEEYAAPAV